MEPAVVTGPWVAATDLRLLGPSMLPTKYLKHGLLVPRHWLEHNAGRTSITTCLLEILKKRHCAKKCYGDDDDDADHYFAKQQSSNISI